MNRRRIAFACEAKFHSELRELSKLILIVNDVIRLICCEFFSLQGFRKETFSATSNQQPLFRVLSEFSGVLWFKQQAGGSETRPYEYPTRPVIPCPAYPESLSLFLSFLLTF